jgi:ParB/RepB/Spo0J family partition protein
MRNLIEQKIELKEIPIDSIFLDPNLARTEKGNIAELALSIKEKGLIHPIAVMKTEEEGKYKLIAGSRRLAAMITLEKTVISVRIYKSDLTPFEFRSIELEENLKRKDMADVERLRAQKTLHDLWIAEFGEKTSTSPKAVGHSAADTARMLGISTSKVSQDLEIAGWLEELPDLAQLKTRAEIHRAISLAKRTAKLDIAAEQYQTSPGEKSKTCESLLNNYLLGDFFTLVKDIPDGSINLIDLDIDYPIEETDQAKRANLDKKINNYTSISKTDFPLFMQKTLAECYRVAAADSWIIIWFGYEYFQALQDWSKQAGFRTSYYHGLWYKGEKRGHTNNPDVTLNHTKEPFFYFKKGSPKLTKPQDDIFTHAPLSRERKIHPYEKPLTLMSRILSTFALPKSRVLVPFAGSGMTLIAAQLLEMYPIGFELSEYYYNQYTQTCRSMFTK